VVVAGRGNEEDIPLVFDGVVKRLGIASPPPAVVGGDDIDAMVLQVPEVIQAFDGAGGITAAFVVQKFAGDQLDVPVDPDYSGAVVAGRTDGPGDMGAMTVVVDRPGVVAVGIDTVFVVHIAVAVVVEDVARRVGGVDPEIRQQIRTGKHVDTGVDHPDHDIAAAGRDVPRIGDADVGAGDAPGLAGIVHSPELIEPDVVGECLNVVEIIRLGILDRRITGIATDCLVNSHSLLQLQVVEALGGKLLHYRSAVPAMKILFGSYVSSRSELDQDFVLPLPLRV